MIEGIYTIITYPWICYLAVRGKLLKVLLLTWTTDSMKYFSFNPLNKEFSPGSCIINIFPSHFYFHPYNKHSNINLKSHTHQLNNLAITSLLDHLYTLIVTDAGIKNNMATSITYIHICNKPAVKTLYYVVNITLIEAKLFSIRYGINQATNISGLSKIIVITNSIHTAKRIFDSSSHPFQINLEKIFLLSTNNSTEFWECLSCCNWPLYKMVDRETKQFHLIP